MTSGLCCIRAAGVLAVLGLAWSLSWAVTEPAQAQDSNLKLDDDLEIIRLRPDFYMIAGAGGNIGVQIGPDGAVLVDAGSLEASNRTIAAVRKLTDHPIRYIINTSADPDHTGGNGALSKAGRSIFAMGTEPIGGEFARAMTGGFAATVVAAETVLLRMSAEGQTPAMPADTWPSETFTERYRNLYLNGQGIQVFRAPAAHSDGDSFVFFRASDVIAAGDVLDGTRFPMIDAKRGGSLQGEIEALNRIIGMSVRPIPFAFEQGGTYIIPGHGHVYSQIEAVEYRDMLVVIRDVVQDMAKRGMTLAQVKEAAPAKGYEPVFGSTSGPWTTNDFVEAVYKAVTGAK